MGEIFEGNSKKSLSGCARKYQHNPNAESLYLLFLALEREVIVAVAYRDDMLARRIQAMPVSAGDSRTDPACGLSGAWKDEEMHAIYIRGVIFKRGSLPLRLRAFIRQLVWHHRWMVGIGSAAPDLEIGTHCRTHLPSFFTWIGIVTGQVPPDVRKYLQHGSFREFCLLSMSMLRRLLT